MNQEIHFSSKTDQWATPQNFFDQMNDLFNFDLDVCADSSNTKCTNYFTIEEDGLKQEWKGVCWMNPPYGREIGSWVKKARISSIDNKATIVCLVPARTDTKWWQENVIYADTVFFLKGRLKFGDAKNSAPFPSAILVFRPRIDDYFSGFLSK